MKLRQFNKASAKLSVADVHAIRRRYEAREATQGALARDYGVSVIQIGRIVRYESWSDLKPEATADSLQRGAEALLRVQHEVDMQEKMEKEIALQKNLAGAGDSLVEELIAYDPTAAEKARKLKGEVK